MQPLDFLMHIPKTAGISLQGIARRRYPAGALELVYQEKSVQKGFIDRRELQLVMGHFPYGYHRLSGRPARYHVFLREPVDQVISHHRYTLDHPEKFPDLKLPISLRDFAKSNYGHNLQSRFISGLREETDPQILYEKACENLRNFDTIGLSESFDESLIMLADALGWKRFYYQAGNAGKARQRISPPPKDEIDELKTLLQADLKLYALARKRFELDKANYPALTARTQRFQKANRLFQKINPFYVRLKKLAGTATDPH